MTSNAWKILFPTPVVLVAEHPWRRRSFYQDTLTSSKVMEEGSIILCQRFVRSMLMHVEPIAGGTQTYSTEMECWRNLMMF